MCQQSWLTVEILFAKELKFVWQAKMSEPNQAAGQCWSIGMKKPLVSLSLPGLVLEMRL